MWMIGSLPLGVPCIIMWLPETVQISTQCSAPLKWSWPNMKTPDLPGSGGLGSLRCMVTQFAAYLPIVLPPHQLRAHRAIELLGILRVELLIQSFVALDDFLDLFLVAYIVPVIHNVTGL